jgi:hypothetical protein
MTDLVLLTFGDDDVVCCTSLDEAKEKASSHSHAKGRILVEITPEGGGPMTTLEFDRKSRDWIAVR